ncbi:MAG TPA: hypothetical protein VGZ00_04800 [Candidatus Baltobacteraceae bacterium]|jgi:ABC-type nickel/cobalt efflux system permease component RcnA|nr:hypothetical protein [Candidatus Baltobacteraceae bacterium]
MQLNEQLHVRAMIRRLFSQARRLGIVLGMLVVVASAALTRQSAWASPFDQARMNAAPTASYPTSPIVQWVHRIQLDASLRLTDATSDLKRHAFGPSLAFAFAFALLYGCVHAAGPGHGKAVVIGYFLSRDAKFLHGLRLSAGIALTHVASAIVIVGVIGIFFGQILPSIEDERSVRLLSYGTITLLGIVLFVQTARRDVTSQGCGHEHGHEYDHEHGHASPKDGRDGTTRILAIAAGMVPCTGSLLVLTYALANHLYLAGVLLVVAIGVGMALTTAFLGIAAAYTRRHFLQRASRRPNASRKLTRALSFAGPSLVIVTGTTLFTLTLAFPMS